uniref:Non-structural protein 5 n=1 Tax=Rotavirus A RVA/Raccoon-tc/JPN/Rac-311/2011/G34P[17] TaxID=1935387 RepID=A0A2Z6FBF3_9REOV|nr:non-structural protein NSP5 [Rotavirus A RVA/Raccoon-tc/JPN/Rac-311/2011/G34P[17]]
MSAITIDFSSLPSFSKLSLNESSSETSNASRKSVSRSEQYVSLSEKAFSEYMLNRDPEDIGPSDSASNDLPTKFAIKSNAVKSNANVGVSLDASSSDRETISPGKDEVDFTFAKGIKMKSDLAASFSIDTTNTKSSISDPGSFNKAVHSTDRSRNKNSSNKKNQSKWPKIEYQSDEEEYVVSDDDAQCCNCIYKRKYFELRKRMKLVAIQLIEDM